MMPPGGCFGIFFGTFFYNGTQRGHFFFSEAESSKSEIIGFLCVSGECFYQVWLV